MYVTFLRLTGLPARAPLSRVFTLCQKQKAPGENPSQAVREVALRALADHRTHRRWGVVIRCSLSS